MSEQLEFLASNRFWALVLGSASTILIDPNFSTQKWYVSVGKFFGLLAAGFIAIRSLDRTVDTINGK